MGWGSTFEKIVLEKKIEQDKEILNIVQAVYSGIDLAQPGTDQTLLTTFEDGEFKYRVISPEELYKNLKPTHDPYTNPKATIYYECGCGEILDPQTKSFAALNNYASKKGWKIRFGADGYTPYCVKCGEYVE